MYAGRDAGTLKASRADCKLQSPGRAESQPLTSVFRMWCLASLRCCNLRASNRKMVSLTAFGCDRYCAGSMNAELGTQLRVAGLLRSPDHEGALAHLDVDRGFALVARGATSLTDVIDPTIWVKEKLSVALLPASGMAGSPGSSGVSLGSPGASGPGDTGEPPLRRVISALRSLHAELVRRPPRDRAWVSVLVALFHAGDGVLVSAGDCACFRFRDGLLSRLRRAGDGSTEVLPPRGALGSEPQVRIDVVPLRPRPGDLYVASTRHLREGELAVLVRDLTSARDGAELLRAGVEGSTDRGRFAIRVLEGEEDASLPARAEALWRAPREEEDDEPEEDAERVLELNPLLPEDELQEVEAEEDRDARTREEKSARDDGPHDDDRYGAPEFLREVEGMPSGVPGAVIGYESAEPPEAVEEEAAREEAANEAAAEEAAASEAARRRPRALAQIEDGPPWYEPLAIWVGGALAIIALALLVRAILPGILGEKAHRGPAPPAAVATGIVDFFSDPPGAVVRVDGKRLAGKTPLASVALEAGAHTIELDWGSAGVWRDTLEVTRGERLAVHPAIYGSVTLRSSEPSRTLDVYVDGAYAGTTPLTLSRVVVGRHLVRFSGPGAGSTTQEIDVLRDAPTEAIGNAGPPPETGRLTVRSALLTDAGFEPGRGDPLWIDGVARGATPLTVALKPGAHSARVVRRGFPAQVTVVDVKAGGDHYVTAEFGARSEQPLQFTPPAALSISNPLPVMVTLPEGEWDPSIAVWLYAAAPDGSFQGRRMTQLEGGDRIFATLVPVEVLQNRANRVRVYFKASGTDGREFYSEIATIPVRP